MNARVTGGKVLPDGLLQCDSLAQKMLHLKANTLEQRDGLVHEGHPL